MGKNQEATSINRIYLRSLLGSGLGLNQDDGINMIVSKHSLSSVIERANTRISIAEEQEVRGLAHEDETIIDPIQVVVITMQTTTAPLPAGISFSTDPALRGKPRPASAAPEGTRERAVQQQRFAGQVVHVYFNERGDLMVDYFLTGIPEDETLKEKLTKDDAEVRLKFRQTQNANGERVLDIQALQIFA